MGRFPIGLVAAAWVLLQAILVADGVYRVVHYL